MHKGEELLEVFILLEGEALSENMVQMSPTASLQQLRVAITEQLDGFDYDYIFLKKSGYFFNLIYFNFIFYRYNNLIFIFILIHILICCFHINF
jgi:hypothetical protein